MGLILPENILEDVSFALIEPTVNTQLNPAGAVVPVGPQTVTPGSMIGIYSGALLITATPPFVLPGFAPAPNNTEIITVVSVTATTFTAVFQFVHQPSDTLVGATFPSGQTGHPLFTQTEVLGYLAEAQNDFLLQVRPVYVVGTVAIKPGKKIYSAPADSIRVERASIVNVATPSAYELWNVTQTDLDYEESGWATSSQPGPTSWYQDQINNQTIGFGPSPQVGNNVTLFYSQRASKTLGLLDQFLIPDPMTIALKWGVLARCFSKDGEQRDSRRANFSQVMYDLIVECSKKFMSGVAARVKSPEETVEPLSATRL